MSVIAYRDGLLCSDSLCTANDRVYGYLTKIFRNQAGDLAGHAGDGGMIDAFREWFLAGCEISTRPSLQAGEQFQALIIKPSGEVFDVGERGHLTRLEGPFFAIGSGAPVATGAMEMGASAEQAVAAAIKWQTSCGGEIQVLRLEKCAPDAEILYEAARLMGPCLNVNCLWSGWGSHTHPNGRVDCTPIFDTEEDNRRWRDRAGLPG